MGKSGSKYHKGSPDWTLAVLVIVNLSYFIISFGVHMIKYQSPPFGCAGRNETPLWLRLSLFQISHWLDGKLVLNHFVL